MSLPPCIIWNSKPKGHKHKIGKMFFHHWDLKIMYVWNYGGGYFEVIRLNMRQELNFCLNLSRRSHKPSIQDFTGDSINESIIGYFKVHIGVQ